MARYFIHLTKIKVMTRRIAKVTNNTQLNFNASREVSYWAKKYNTSQEEIQDIFHNSGYSISKTIAILQEKAQQRSKAA